MPYATWTRVCEIQEIHVCLLNDFHPWNASLVLYCSVFHLIFSEDLFNGVFCYKGAAMS